MIYEQLEFEFMKKIHEQERWENANWLEKLARKIIGVKNQRELDYLYSLNPLSNCELQMRI